MVLSNIQPSLCRDNIITRIGIDHLNRNHWTITGSVKFGNTFHFTGGIDRDLIVDTGAGGIFFPQSLHQTFRNHLLSLKIPSMRVESLSRGDIVWANFINVGLIPPIQISLKDISGNLVSVRIPSRSLFSCEIIDRQCRLRLESLPSSFDMFLLGLPFFRAFNVEFDSTQGTVSFCEPSSSVSQNDDPPLIQGLKPPPPPPHSKTNKNIQPFPKTQEPPQYHPSVLPPPLDEQSLREPPFIVPRLAENLDDRYENFLEEIKKSSFMAPHSINMIICLTLLFFIIII